MLKAEGMEPAALPMSIWLFGPFSARVGHRPLPRLRSRKGEWLLALLVLQRGRGAERGWLAGTLWPDSPEEQALYNLRRELVHLRRALGPEARRLGAPARHLLSLDLEGAEADVVRFDAEIARGDMAALETAAALYRGPLLADCREEWVLPDRAAREEAYLRALETLAAHDAAGGDHVTAASRLRLAASVDPLRETCQRALMQALAAANDTVAATRVYLEFRFRLHREMNAAPGPETRTLFEQIRVQARERAQATVARIAPGEAEAGRAIPSPRRSAERPPHPSAATVPRPLTRLIGRDDVVRQVRQLLEEARLVTLTGAGGVGKTRLAIRIAEELLEDTPDGVWFADLAALTRPALVEPAVAGVLGVREEPHRPLQDTLAEALRRRSLILVLDNCEHLGEACAALIDALLRACPRIRVLATSRQPLGLVGEVTARVPSLATPDTRRTRPEAPGDDATWPDCPSVELFLERARQVDPAFETTCAKIRAIVQICQRLDGTPLAIELAAARVRALAVEEIAARLDDRFRLLQAGGRAAPPRQRTLRATMDWSHELLSEAERTLLRRLSVFAGGWTLEAAEAVCGDCGLRIADCGLRIGGAPKPASCRGSAPSFPNPQSAIRNPQSRGARPPDLPGGLVARRLRRGRGQGEIPAAGDGPPVCGRAAAGVRRGRRGATAPRGVVRRLGGRGRREVE